MALTDTAIRNAKPTEKPYKVADSQGLYLLVNPRGSKLWRVKYRMNGVERKLALGSYPEITLTEALPPADRWLTPSIRMLLSGKRASRRAFVPATVSLPWPRN
ncbi:MAG: Arm DNA-binding domain-containing protein [Novosphingobium meiothermophilum]|uniref:Arm DNA-binding domain-containing protein n=1 Tax=Novosphingobium meiothermophilum TaxID=2202251 RepID=UPI001F393C4A|nr:Arm DNA-binding domain-containing protein [Novosphingobium meiothermophilum]